MKMFGNRTLDRLDQMLNEAMTGEFQEEKYDETKLSRLESKWKSFLAASALSKANLTREKENVKSLVSDISHQTKTPMTNIKLYGSLLEEAIAAEPHMEQKESCLHMIEELIRQIEKLEFLLQALTKMSRLESNIVEVVPQWQKVAPLMRETVEEMQGKAAKKQVTLQYYPPLENSDLAGRACFDFKWTKEALGNVMDNAIKYSKDGGVVTISVIEYEMYTAISVKDQGIGIREEEMAKIFGRFYRAEEVNQEEGVGIGLYLTREILKKQDGYIKVRSKPGKGAEFILFLSRKANEIE